MRHLSRLVAALLGSPIFALFCHAARQHGDVQDVLAQLHVYLGEDVGAGTSFVYSPSSLFVVLAGAMAGSGPTGRAALYNFFSGHSAGEVATAMETSHLSDNLLRGGGVFESVGNIYVRKDFEALSDSHGLQEMMSVMRSNVSFVNFTRETERQINKHVSQVTRGIIKEVVHGFKPSTSVFLLSVVYLKADWLHPFHCCREGVFYGLSDKLTLKVQSGIEYINQVASPRWRRRQLGYGYFQSLDDGCVVDVVSVPLKALDSKLSMVFFVPCEPAELPAFQEKRMGKPQLLDELLTSMDDSNIDSNESLEIVIPKFKVRSNFGSLSDALSICGLNVSDVILEEFNKSTGVEVKQEAYIRVDENGIEAAAATSMDFVDGGASVEIDQRVVVNSAFVFQVRYEPAHSERNRSTNVVLFEGVVANMGS